MGRVRRVDSPDQLAIGHAAQAEFNSGFRSPQWRGRSQSLGSIGRMIALMPEGGVGARMLTALMTLVARFCRSWAGRA